MPTLSIITASYNARATIADCLDSVAGQTFPAEHIVIDGASRDGTAQIVRDRFAKVKLISEPDQGIYDAMNKGLALASGDIVGILNADDFYVDDRVLEKVVGALERQQADCLFADMVIVSVNNTNKIIRYYRGNDFRPELMAYGRFPPHPTFFVRREIYQKFGTFKTSYQIAADFEIIARLLVRHRISYTYLPEILVKMRTGGVSSRNLKSTLVINQEIVRACRENGIETNYFKIYSKYLTKVAQWVRRPAPAGRKA